MNITHESKQALEASNLVVCQKVSSPVDQRQKERKGNFTSVNSGLAQSMNHWLGELITHTSRFKQSSWPGKAVDGINPGGRLSNALMTVVLSRLTSTPALGSGRVHPTDGFLTEWEAAAMKRISHWVCTTWVVVYFGRRRTVASNLGKFLVGATAGAKRLSPEGESA